jgi:hypothetical protein
MERAQSGTVTAALQFINDASCRSPVLISKGKRIASIFLLLCEPTFPGRLD